MQEDAVDIQNAVFDVFNTKWKRHFRKNFKVLFTLQQTQQHSGDLANEFIKENHQVFFWGINIFIRGFESKVWELVPLAKVADKFTRAVQDFVVH